MCLLSCHLSGCFRRGSYKVYPFEHCAGAFVQSMMQRFLQVEAVRVTVETVVDLFTQVPRPDFQHESLGLDMRFAVLNSVSL